MKEKLMIQSLSPLAVLTVIKNFSFIIEDSSGVKLDVRLFIATNLPLLIVMVICILWICLAVVYLLSFNAFKYAGSKGGYSIKIINKKEDDSLNFFLTLVLPLLIDDVNTWQGALLFIVVLCLVWGLSSYTKLFYANPVLALLGYRVLEIAFLENKDKNKETYIAITRGNLDETHNIEYKEITEEVLFVKKVMK